MRMKVADFFCGGGGFSEGFRQAGFDLVFAVDKWEPAVLTYKGNKPNAKVIQDDVIKISELCEKEFEELVPDTEVIIGSPPCQAFSHSNKSGNADKTLGIKLVEAFLKIIVRKKYKKNSILKYWVLENVPNVQGYIKDKYTAQDLGVTELHNIDINFELKPKGGESGIYNAKDFGAPTNRKRYICGEFPSIEKYMVSTVITLGEVLQSLGDPLNDETKAIVDINYPDLKLEKKKITDHQYIHELATFEWETAKRLKQDKGYMGKMSFPENINKPARTVMATMATSSREAMILEYGKNGYRLPTVREVATMMSFPIDYWFYGKSKGIKHTLVGNAVPPKLSYAVANAISNEMGIDVPDNYIPIEHNPRIPFINLNGTKIPINEEKNKRDVAKFKYHIPYLIIDAYRVELTNYHSEFENKIFKWDVEIHYSQGRNRAAVYSPQVEIELFNDSNRRKILDYLKSSEKKVVSFDKFQKQYCMTSEERSSAGLLGPYELLDEIKAIIDSMENNNNYIAVDELELPEKIVAGYYILQKFVEKMRKTI